VVLLKKFFDDQDKAEIEFEQRRAVRIGGSLLDDIYFEIPIEGNQGNIRIQIANLSTTGLLLMGGQFDIPDEVEGTIGYKENNMKVKIKVVRKDMYMFGVKVIEKMDDFAKFMDSIFEMEFAAAQASVVSADKLKEVEHGEPTWIISRKGHSVFFIVDEGEIDAYSIHIGDHLIERQDIGGKELFKVFAVDEDKRKEMFYSGSDMLEEEEPSEAIYLKAKKLVLAIRGLSDEQRQFIEIDLYKMFKDCMP
jgi:hypothetical protein